METKLDGRKKAPQLLPRKAAKVTNAQVKRIIEAFKVSGQSQHSGNATTLQYLIDYCEQERIAYSISVLPGKGYYIQTLRYDYISHGNPETTAAVQYLLDKTLPSARWGGPHRWNNVLLRFVGKMMNAYAKLEKEKLLSRFGDILSKQPCQGNISAIYAFYKAKVDELRK